MLIRAVTILSAVALVGSATMRTPDGARCSLAAFGAGRDPAAMYLLGVATADTQLAGAGATTPSTQGGHVGRGTPRDVYGQVVTISRFGGADSAVLAEAFAQRGSQQVLVVPWDYDASCAPSVWSRSAQFVTSDQLGFYTISLRAREHWGPDGMPTFDAFAANFDPYPHGLVYVQGLARPRPSPADSLPLSATEYYELYRTLPPFDAFRDSADTAFEPFRSWIRDHPALASRYPATVIIRSFHNAVASSHTQRQLGAIKSPVIGTWRLTFTIDSTDTHTVYARSRATPTSALRLPPSQLGPDSMPLPRPVEAYSMLVSGATHLDSLPMTCTADRRLEREAYFYIENESGAAEVKGQVELHLLARVFSQDSALRRMARGTDVQEMRSAMARARNDSARFFVDGIGVMRVQQQSLTWDGHIVDIRGERVSVATIACN